jgi:hypothetical protein
MFHISLSSSPHVDSQMDSFLTFSEHGQSGEAQFACNFQQKLSSLQINEDVDGLRRET